MRRHVRRRRRPVRLGQGHADPGGAGPPARPRRRPPRHLAPGRRRDRDLRQRHRGRVRPPPRRRRLRAGLAGARAELWHPGAIEQRTRGRPPRARQPVARGDRRGARPFSAVADAGRHRAGRGAGPAPGRARPRGRRRRSRGPAASGPAMPCPRGGPGETSSSSTMAARWRRARALSSTRCRLSRSGRSVRRCGNARSSPSPNRQISSTGSGSAQKGAVSPASASKTASPSSGAARRSASGETGTRPARKDSPSGRGAPPAAGSGRAPAAGRARPRRAARGSASSPVHAGGGQRVERGAGRRGHQRDEAPDARSAERRQPEGRGAPRPALPRRPVEPGESRCPPASRKGGFSVPWKP